MCIRRREKPDYEYIERLNRLIFYDKSMPHLSQIVENMTPYMLYEIPKTENKIINEEILKEEKKKNYEMIVPTHNDSLFWSVYIVVYGYSDYLQVSRNYGVRQAEVNGNALNFLQKNPSLFKETNRKVTKVCIQEILSELSTINKTTSMDALLGLCVFFKINIYIIDKETNGLLKIITNNEKTYLIHRERKRNYSVCMDELSEEKMKELEENNIVLDSCIRPLKTISNYKVEQLVDMATQLELYDTTCKYKKNELYNIITSKLKW